jgi:hypothetical protein
MSARNGSNLRFYELFDCEPEDLQHRPVFDFIRESEVKHVEK